MAIDSSRQLRHMSWANQRVFEIVQTLPVEALESYLTNPEFTVAKILHHIVDGAEWYGYCITGQHHGFKQVYPKEMGDVAVLAAQLLIFDATLLEQSARDDEMLSIVEGEVTTRNLLSTLIAQSVHHATEHRAQLVDALELRGYPAINLDDLDLWAFEAFER